MKQTLRLVSIIICFLTSVVVIFLGIKNAVDWVILWWSADDALLRIVQTATIVLIYTVAALPTGFLGLQLLKDYRNKNKRV